MNLPNIWKINFISMIYIWIIKIEWEANLLYRKHESPLPRSFVSSIEEFCLLYRGVLSPLPRSFVSSIEEFWASYILREPFILLKLEIAKKYYLCGIDAFCGRYLFEK